MCGQVLFFNSYECSYLLVSFILHLVSYLLIIFLLPVKISGKQLWGLMFQRALGVGPRNAETPLLSSWLMSPGGETGAKKVTL